MAPNPDQPKSLFMDNLKYSFVDVPIDKNNRNAVETLGFIEAVEALLPIFSPLGSGLGLVKADLSGNVTKIAKRQLAAPDQSASLQDLVANELKAGESEATEGLWWLLHGLELVYASLERNLEDPSEELSRSFREAYKDTISIYHKWSMQMGFSAAMMACPYRKNFYDALADDQVSLIPKLRAYLAALGNILRIVIEFIDSTSWKPPKASAGDIDKLRKRRAEAAARAIMQGVA